MLILLSAALALWALGFAFLWRVPVCVRSDAPGGRPRLSVIIPARDEAENLQNLLPSLTGQEEPPAEIWVVDDQSQDGTAETARRLGAKVASAGDLPPGWLGKPWACQRGADLATGDLLIFLDADCVVEPGGLRKMTDTFLRQPGVLSITPYQRVPTWGEQFSAFFSILQAAGLNAFTVLGKRLKPGGLFGPCLMVGKQDYQRAGGHAAVRDQILENHALAKPLEALGLEPVLVGGRGTLSVRLYPRGLGALVRGWAKSFGRGAGRTPHGTLAATILWISGMIITLVNLTLAWRRPGSAAGFAWLGLYLAYAAQVGLHLRRLGDFKFATAAGFPVCLLFFLGVFTGAAAATGLKKEVRWKGRVLPR